MRQKPQTAGTPPLGIGVGEVHADIAEGGGSQDGVGDGVGQYVSVGMAFKAEVGGDSDTSEDQRTVRGETVDVPTLACAVFSHLGGVLGTRAGRGPNSKAF